MTFTTQQRRTYVNKSNNFVTFLTVCTLTLLCLARTLCGQCYTVVPIVAPQGTTNTYPQDMNSNGVVTGHYTYNSNNRGFIWNESMGFTDMGDNPYWTNGQIAPRGLNDHNEVVGWMMYPSSTSVSRAFKWTIGSGFQIMPSPLGDQGSDCYDINNAGVAIGNTYSPHSAISWKNGVMQDWWNSAFSFGSYAICISETGIVGGYLTLGSSSGHLFNTPWWIPGFSVPSVVYKCSANGIILGSHNYADSSVFYALPGQQVQSVPNGNWVNHHPAGINDNLIICTHANDLGQDGGIWHPTTGWFNLDDLLGEDADGWHIEATFAINNKNQIAATAIWLPDGSTHAVLLQPVSGNDCPLPNWCTSTDCVIGGMVLMSVIPYPEYSCPADSQHKACRNHSWMED
jgi:hypothetical protein